LFIFYILGQAFDLTLFIFYILGQSFDLALFIFYILGQAFDLALFIFYILGQAFDDVEEPMEPSTVEGQILWERFNQLDTW